jgi:hypothetical protein
LTKYVQAITIQAVTRITPSSETEFQSLSYKDMVIENLRSTAKTDPTYRELVRLCEEGFPKSPEELSPQHRFFWKIRNDICTEDGIVLYGSQIVVPEAKRKEILVKLHASHQGIERTKQRARRAVFWPGITSDITNTVRSCTQCQENQQSIVREPMVLEHLPSRVFEEVAIDLFSHSNNHYLVYVDRLSGWPTIDVWIGKDPCTKDVTRVLSKNFADLGIPVKLRSDGGPQFKSSEFSTFMEKWGVSHTFSSPHYAQSNGLAESAVKAMKALVLKTTPTGRLDDDAFRQGLLEWRNTPKAHGASPSEIVFGHCLRSIIPAHHSSFAKKWEMGETYTNSRNEGRKKAKIAYDAHSRNIKPFSIGTPVRIQNPASKQWDKQGVIISAGSNRDYKIRLSNGRVYWRNRRFVRRNYPTDHSSPEATSATKNGAGLGSDGGTGGQPDRESDTQENAAEIHRRSSRKRRTPSRLTL